MKLLVRLLVWLGLSLLGTCAHADQKIDPFRELPKDDWSVLAVQHLAKMGLLDDFPSIILSRYGVTVTTARIINKVGFAPHFAPESGIDSLAVLDILVALNYEYRDELFMLARDPFSVTEGAIDREAYFLTKRKHPMDSSTWYHHAQEDSWLKDYQESRLKAHEKQLQNAPPRLKIVPPAALQPLNPSNP